MLHFRRIVCVSQQMSVRNGKAFALFSNFFKAHRFAHRQLPTVAARQKSRPSRLCRMHARHSRRLEDGECFTKYTMGTEYKDVEAASS